MIVRELENLLQFIIGGHLKIRCTEEIVSSRNSVVKLELFIKGKQKEWTNY